MAQANFFHLTMRVQRLLPDEQGHSQWKTTNTEREVLTNRTALILCDLWDQHWSRGATERVAAMAPRINTFIQAARQAGAWVIHAPSETLAFYEPSPARKRMMNLPAVQAPRNRRHANPRLPIDDSDGGSDTGEKSWFQAWTRQHPAIEIDEARDGISDDGLEIYRFLHAHTIEQVLIAGVHTNMCILNRSFGIKQMVRWGIPVALVRDLTDAMYNPARAPYVSHAEGTRLVIEYIEKFWCPTMLSTELREEEG